MIILRRRRQVCMTSSMLYTNFTGLPVILESNTEQKSPARESFLVPPKPPPMKGWITLTLFRGSLKQEARCLYTKYGLCLAGQMVMPEESHNARAAGGSRKPCTH